VIFLITVWLPVFEAASSDTFAAVADALTWLVPRYGAMSAAWPHRCPGSLRL
jgi:hypothetical protein